MSEQWLCNLEFKHEGIYGKHIKKVIDDIFLKERHLYCKKYQGMVDDINKAWHVYFPDADLDDEEWFKRYCRFASARVQQEFDKLNKKEKGRLLNWYVDENTCDIYARIKHLPNTKIEVFMINLRKEEPE